MKSTIVLCILSVVFSRILSDPTYVGHALLVPIHQDVPLYEYLGDSVPSCFITNDTICENYPLIAILSITDSMAYVCVDYPLGGPSKQGFMKTEYLGIRLAVYSDSVKVMSAPSYSSRIAFTINNPQWGNMYRIYDAKEKWLLIQNLDNECEKGWLAPEYQCDNPYTTCRN